MRMVSSMFNKVTLNPEQMDLQLCFNKAHFNRQDFDVDRFVSLARRRATLDQIQQDLRTYLRYLQNSMVELINDDYADFVNLSSNLAALKESIHKISLNFETTWSCFSDSINDIRTVAEFVDSKCVELTANKHDQILIRNKISLILSIERLSKGLTQKSAMSTWLLKLVNLVVDVELWYAQLPEEQAPQQAKQARKLCYDRIRNTLVEQLILDLKNKCTYTGTLLLLLSLIGETDYAILKISNSVVNKEIQDNILTDTSIKKDEMLKNLFDQIFVLRKKWIESLKSQSQYSPKAEEFLDKCLLTYCLFYFDENFGSILVPSDNKLFHKCYKITIQFIEEWPTNKPIAILKSILNKFNTIVYFKMATQQFLLEIKKQTKNFDLNTIFEKDPESDYNSIIANTALTSISVIFSNDVYIPVLIDKFWDFTLKILENYAEWLKNINSYLALKNVEESSASNKPMESWLALTKIHFDADKFNSKIFELFSNIICKNLKDFNVEIRPFSECLLLFSEAIKIHQQNIFTTIINLLTEKTIKALGGVIEIPRQYRWTKKPAPSCFSPYLAKYFSICEEFENEAKKIGWKNEQISELLKKVIENSSNVFCEKAEQVLSSVEQTGSSLQRFKRKTVAEDSATNLADTDESKIRNQLIFDVNFMKQRATDYGIDFERLQILQSRAQTD